MRVLPLYPAFLPPPQKNKITWGVYLSELTRHFPCSLKSSFEHERANECWCNKVVCWTYNCFPHSSSGDENNTDTSMLWGVLCTSLSLFLTLVYEIHLGRSTDASKCWGRSDFAVHVVQRFLPRSSQHGCSGRGRNGAKHLTEMRMKLLKLNVPQVTRQRQGDKVSYEPIVE